MSTLSYTPGTSIGHALIDSGTMLRRNLVHQLRYPSLTLFVVGIPVVLLLLFVYVFGPTLGAGLGTATVGSGNYIDFVVPGILLIGIASAAQGTAISVSMDMTQGIIARFRTMDISRAAVLTGHVIASMLQTLLGVAVLLGVALLLGYRPTADPMEWLQCVGVVIVIAFAITWFSVALGIIAKTVESASNLPMILILLPFFGSGFVPTETMPPALQWFAEYQPFTPFIDTIRGLLSGSPIGNSGLVSVAWCIVIALASYLWARSAYNRKSLRTG